MNISVPRSIGRRLKDSRLSAGFTQLDVAASSDVSRQTVSAWEHGSLLSVRQLYDLCLLYGVSSDFVLFGIRTVPASKGKMVEEIFREAERLSAS